MKCVNCQKSFLDKRSTALFCGSTCRQQFHRKTLSVTKRHFSVTEEKRPLFCEKEHKGRGVYSLTCGCYE